MRQRICEATEGGRAALAAGGVDVAALDAALGYGDEFGFG
jgi:hypothetical protein